jgi:Txe/YoeB family toxin of Txe-Axe toxin-antitoxin module
MQNLLADLNQYLLLNIAIATKLDQSQSYEPLETALATTYSRLLNA